MAEINSTYLRGFELLKGDYFKKQVSDINAIDTAPIHFIHKKDKTKEWKQWVSDHFESIGLDKVSLNSTKVIKNRWLSSGKLNINDYINNKQDYYKHAQEKGVDIHMPVEDFNDDFYFYPLIPNIVNLFTGYQLKRNTKFKFEVIDTFSKSEMMDKKDKEFKTILMENMMKLRDDAVAKIKGEDKEQKFNELMAKEQLVQKQIEFKSYKNIAVEWANRTHKINYSRFELRNLLKQAFKESYLNSSKVIFHLNMMENDFKIEHIDEAYAFYGVIPNSQYITDSDYIGWFKWMNISEVLDNFGKILGDEDIVKLQSLNTAIGKNSLSLINMFDQSAHEGYDTTRNVNNQSNDPIDIVKYKKKLKDTYGLEFENQSIHQNKTNVDSNLKYGVDKLYRIMYVYVKSQKRIGWLTKHNRFGELEISDWITEDYIVTEEPIYDFSKNKNKVKENLMYGEHIDWEWISDWRRFITLTPNEHHKNYSDNGKYMDKIYIDGESLAFQFKSDTSVYGVKPPISAIEIKMRGVDTISLVDLLKPDQVFYNITKNKSINAVKNDRGLVFQYPTNLVPRVNSDIEDDGDLLDDYERSIMETKTLRLQYDKQYIAGNNQISAPGILNLSTLSESLQYEQLSEKIWHNALRTVGVTPQAMGEIKASEEVSNSKAAQQISQIQTELIYDEFNTRFIPDLYSKILEATQYYSMINKDYRVIYQNDNDENTWLDMTGIDILHKDFMCKPMYSFDNQEFSELIKRLAFDNTLQESLLTRLKVIASADENIGKVLSLLEESEMKSAENASKMQEAKEREIKMTLDSNEKIKQQEIDNDNMNKERDRQVKIYTEEISIMGSGIQTDANKDMKIDSVENFKNTLKERELLLKERLGDSKIENQSSYNKEVINLKREEMMLRNTISENKLKEAIVNRNEYSEKEIDKKLIKK